MAVLACFHYQTYHEWTGPSLMLLLILECAFEKNIVRIYEEMFSEKKKLVYTSVLFHFDLFGNAELT